MNILRQRHPYDPDKPVQVYRNLHADCWSVRQKGLVVLHADSITLKNVELRVNPAGRNKVRREGRKNVHAFVTGTITDELILDEKYPVSYNPYSDDTFVYLCTNWPCKTARYAILDINAVNKVLVT